MTRAMRLINANDPRTRGVAVQSLLDALTRTDDDEVALSTLTASAARPATSRRECACFDPKWNPMRCRKLALAVYVYLTQNEVATLDDGWGRAADRQPVHVVFDTAGPWRAEWFDRDGVFDVIVVHASTVAIWLDATRDTRIDSQAWCEYAHPIEFADAIRHWDELLAPVEGAMSVANIIVRAADLTGKVSIYGDGVGLAASESLTVEQRRVIDHALGSFDPSARGGCMLCLGMGMGKTRVALTIAARVVATFGRADWRDWRLAIVAPRGVLDTFATELHVTLPTLWSGGSARKDALLYAGEDDDGPIVFVTHSQARRDVSTEADDAGSLTRWADKQRAAHRRILLLIDEAHHANDRSMSGEQTNLYKCCMQLAMRSAYVVAMTGTPFVNAPRDATRLLRLASADPTADAQLNTLATDCAQRNVAVAWLMTRTTSFPLQISHRRPVPMKPAVWENLKRFYDKQAIEVVRAELDRMKRGGGAAAELTFRHKLRKTLERAGGSDAIVAIASDEARSLVDILQRLEAADLWSYPFYLDTLWLKDTFYTKSEEYTYRCDDDDDDGVDDDHIEFYAAEFEPRPWTPPAATPPRKTPSVPTTGPDERPPAGESACRRFPASEHAASCFNEAIRLLNEVVAKKELPVVFHCGRLDPGIESLYDILLRDRKETKARISPRTYALITGESAWIGTEQQRGEEDGSTPTEIVQRHFRAGKIDVLCFSRVAREGVAFVVKAPLARQPASFRRGVDADGPPTLSLASDGRVGIVNRMLRDKRVQFEKAVPCYAVPFDDAIEIGDKYVHDAMPAVRHFCHVGMTWNFATMRQAEGRVMRRDSHPRQHDDVVAPFLHGVLRVHTIVTIRPEASAFSTHDERMEALCFAKEGRIQSERDRFSSSVPTASLQ